MEKSKQWVPGWLFETAFIILAALWLFVKGSSENANIFIVGAIIIGVTRRIEKERRAGNDLDRN